MANAFARELCQHNSKPAMSLSRPALELLRQYDWPGNVRQLRTAVEHGVVMSDAPTIEPEDLPGYLVQAAGAPVIPVHQVPQSNVHTEFGLDFAPSFNLQYIERQVILRALAHTGGNRSAAAELLGINRRTLQRKMAEAKDVFQQYL